MKEDIDKSQVTKPVVGCGENAKLGTSRYNISFEAHLIHSDDATKHRYNEIKNELLSYGNCKSRISWKRETFKANKEIVARLVYRGQTLCIFLPLSSEQYSDNKIVEKTSLPTYSDTPVFVRLKNEKRLHLAIELIGKVMEERGLVRGTYVSQDFYTPYEDIVELINRRLIRCEIRTAEEEAIFQRHEKK